MAKPTEFPEALKVQFREGTLDRILQRVGGNLYKRAQFVREAAERRLLEEELANGVRPVVPPEVEAAARLIAKCIYHERALDPAFDIEAAVDSDWPRFVESGREMVEVVGKAKGAPR